MIASHTASVDALGVSSLVPAVSRRRCGTGGDHASMIARRCTDSGLAASRAQVK
jgi:hypothetical protein